MREGDAGLQEVLGLWQRFEFFVGRHHVLEKVALADFPLDVGYRFGEETGAMEVDVRIEKVVAESVDLGGEALRDMAVAEVFAHDGAILGFRQAVVVTMAGTRLGEFDLELFQHRCHGVVDVLRAIIGMEAQDPEREAGKNLFQDGQQVGLAQALAGGDDFHLGEAVHGVDVIEPLDPVLIALVDTVDADEAGVGARRWPMGTA